MPSAAQNKSLIHTFTQFMHYGPCTFVGCQWDIPISSPSVFAPPDDASTDGWVETAAMYGATQICLTVRHVDGFRWVPKGALRAESFAITLLPAACGQRPPTTTRSWRVRGAVEKATSWPTLLPLLEVRGSRHGPAVSPCVAPAPLPLQSTVCRRASISSSASTCTQTRRACRRTSTSRSRSPR